MTGTLSPLPYKGADGKIIGLAGYDQSGNGTGPFFPIHQAADANGNIITPGQDSSLVSIGEILANIYVFIQGTVAVADRNAAPFTTAAVMTAGGSTVAPGRVVEVICTVAGNVSLQLSSGIAHIVPAIVGRQEFKFAAIGINTSGTSATATYANLS